MSKLLDVFIVSTNYNFIQIHTSFYCTIGIADNFKFVIDNSLAGICQVNYE